MASLIVTTDNSELEGSAKDFAERHHLPFFSHIPMSDECVALVFSSSGCFLQSQEKNSRFSVGVNFTSGALDHRRKFGGGKGQNIAKAVGLSKGYMPSMLDATAGLGRDAFVLATLGADVTLLERSPIVHLLLEDGLRRANDLAVQNRDGGLNEILSRMNLQQGDAHKHLKNCSSYDVVLLDPMFPERKKSALVKKEMQIFHTILGTDDDAENLLEPALAVAEYRVVVKRPRISPHLAEAKPTYSLTGKSSRFDIYVKRALPV